VLCLPATDDDDDDDAEAERVPGVERAPATDEPVLEPVLDFGLWSDK